MTQEAEKGGKVPNLAGYFTQAVREGYTSTTEAKAKKQTETKAKAEAEKAREEAEAAKKEQAKKEHYQKEKAIFLAMVKANPALVDELLETGRHSNSIRQGAVAKYDPDQTFEENLASGGVVLATTLQAIAKERYPEKFA